MIALDKDPANGRPNHIQLPPQDKLHLIVLDLFTDWVTQNPVSLEVRRLKPPLLTPALSKDFIPFQVNNRHTQIVANGRLPRAQCISSRVSYCSTVAVQMWLMRVRHQAGENSKCNFLSRRMNTLGT